MTGRHRKGPGVARRHDRFGDFGEIVPDAFIEGMVIGWRSVDRIADDRRRGPPRGRIGRGLGLWLCSHDRLMRRTVSTVRLRTLSSLPQPMEEFLEQNFLLRRVRAAFAGWP